MSVEQPQSNSRLIAPVFLAMVIGIFHLSLLGFTFANLNYAVEKRARCDAIASGCPDIVNVLLRAGPRACLPPSTEGRLRHGGQCDSHLPVECIDLSKVHSAIGCGMLPLIGRLDLHHLNDRRGDDDSKQHGKEEDDHRNRELGGNAAAFFSASFILISRFSCA